MPRTRRGFTLVELLVVIAIIGVLVALLLPAVQAAREAARRTKCANNLKQLGLALHNYHDTRLIFPPGSIWYSSAAPQSEKNRGSILVHILPFMEQQPLYEQFKFDGPVESQTDSTGKLLASVIVPGYVCPSDNRNFGLLNNRAVHNYCASSGPTKHADSPTCTCPTGSSWNSYGMAPYGSPTQFAGAFIRYPTSIKMKDVTDGLSSTIFFGEVLRGCSNHVNGGWVQSNNANGLTSTLPPINYDTCDTTAPSPCNQPCNWSVELGFRSRHPGGAQFLFGDGAVRLLSENIDHQNYQYLGAKADGFVAELP